MKTIDIMYEDLTKEKQQELLELANKIVPICKVMILERGEVIPNQEEHGITASEKVAEA